MLVTTQSVIWLLILLLQFIKSGIAVELIMTPSPVTEGGSLTLTCSVSENSSIFASFNYETGTSIGFVQLSGGQCIDGAGQTCNQQCTCTTDGKSFSWTISSVTRSWDKARVRCLVNNPTASNSDVIVVKVTYPPTGIMVVTPSGTQFVLTETQVTLQCQVGGGNPLATLTWQCKGSPVTGQNLINTTTAVSSLTFTVDRTYHQQQCVCTAGHQASPGGQFGTASVNFNVIYPPGGTLTVTPSGTQSVLSGTQVTLKCQVGGGNPLATLTWQCKGSPVTGQNLTNTTTAVSSLTFTVDSTYHQQQCVCTAGHQASPGGQFGTVSVGVNVTYPPTGTLFVTPSGTHYVLKGTPVTLRCQVRGGNPLATLTWHCKGSPVTGQDLTNTTTAMSSLTFTVDSTYHQQQCVCTAGHQASPNGQFGTVSVRFEVTSLPVILISPLDDPYVTRENQTGVTFTCAATSTNPPVTSIVWMKESKTLSTTGLYSLPVITKDLAGVYTCSATNDIGTTTANITMQVLCDEGISSDAIDTISTPSTVLLVVGIVLILIGFTACGIGIFLYRKARLFGRSVNQQEPVTKLDTFSNAMPMKTERNEEDAESSSHYQELRQYDIGKPSIYDCPSQATNPPGNRTNNPNKMTSTPSTRTQSRLHKSFTNAQKATDG